MPDVENQLSLNGDKLDPVSNCICGEKLVQKIGKNNRVTAVPYSFNTDMETDNFVTSYLQR